MKENNDVIRILHVIGRMGCGGAEAMLMNIYRKIDRRKVQFDFVVHTQEKSFYDDEILSLGGKIYHTERYMVKNYFSYKKWWNQFLQLHPEYKIIHGHINSSAAIYLSCAKKMNRIAVVHSHATRNIEKNLRSFVFLLMAYPIRYISQYFFACSKQAGIDRFGLKVANSDKFVILKNGIDAEKFQFCEENRKKIRLQNDALDSTMVLGHVGRFTIAKNHEFLIKLYSEFCKQYPDSQLWLVGEGELKAQIEQWIQFYNIQNKVKFLPISKHVEEYLQGMDVFVFPSVFEGLGIALVEAQATGLPCVVSENIQPEADIGANLVKRLDLQKNNISEWVKTIYDMKGSQRLVTKENIQQAGFDINKSAKILENFYVELWRK